MKKYLKSVWLDLEEALHLLAEHDYRNVVNRIDKVQASLENILDFGHLSFKYITEYELMSVNDIILKYPGIVRELLEIFDPRVAEIASSLDQLSARYHKFRVYVANDVDTCKPARILIKAHDDFGLKIISRNDYCFEFDIEKETKN